MTNISSILSIFCAFCGLKYLRIWLLAQRDHCKSCFFSQEKTSNLKQKHLPRSSTERKTVAKTNLMFTFTFWFLSVHRKCSLFVVFRSQEENTHFSVVVNSNKNLTFICRQFQEMLSPIQDVIHFFGSTDPSTLAGPKLRKC